MTLRLALVLRGLHELVQAAEVFGRGGGSGVDAALGGGVGLLLGRRAGAEGDDRGQGGQGCEALADVHWDLQGVAVDQTTG